MPALPIPEWDLATVAGVECNTPAWALQNSWVLRRPAPRRGQNISLPQTDGSLARRRYDTERVVDLEFYVIGDVDQEGTPNLDPIVGVEENVSYLIDNIYRATTDSLGQVTCTYDTATTAYEGPVQVDNFEIEPGIGNRRVFIQLTIPRGELEPVGS